MHGHRLSACGAAQAGRRPLFMHRCAGLGLQGLRQFVGRRQTLRHELLEAALPQGRERPMTYAEGRKHAGIGVNQHGFHAQGSGHTTGELPPRTAETVEYATDWIMPPGNGDALDGCRHVLHGDIDRPVGQLLRLRDATRDRGHPGDQSRESVSNRRDIQWFIAVYPEDPGEICRANAPEQDIAIGHGQRTTTAVAGGSRVGTGGVRTHPQTGAVEVDDRPAAGGDRLQRKGGRCQSMFADHGFTVALVAPGIMAHIGRGTAHIETDSPLESRRARGLGHADHPARGPGEQRMAGIEGIERSQSAVGFHEQQSHTR